MGTLEKQLKGVVTFEKNHEEGGQTAFVLKNAHLRIRDPTQPSMKPSVELRGKIIIREGHSTKDSTSISIAQGLQPSYILRYHISSDMVPGTCDRYIGRWGIDEEVKAVFTKVLDYQQLMHLLISDQN